MNQCEFFDAAAATWDDLETAETRGRLAEIVAGLGIAPGAAVLDVGCGTGILFPLLRAAMGGQGRLVALDISREMLRRAQAKGYAAVCVQGDAEQPPLAHVAFDWIICNAVLPHFADKRATLTELGCRLAAGGTLVICHGNNRQTINAIHRDVGGVVAQDKVPDAGHMAQMLRDAGLRPLHILDGADRYVALAQRDPENNKPRRSGAKNA